MSIQKKQMKSVNDAIYWTDDGQISILHVTKSYSEPSGIRIRVKPIDQNAGGDFL